jgi:hypothetical protein
MAPAMVAAPTATVISGEILLIGLVALLYLRTPTLLFPNPPILPWPQANQLLAIYHIKIMVLPTGTIQPHLPQLQQEPDQFI